MEKRPSKQLLVKQKKDTFVNSRLLLKYIAMGSIRLRLEMAELKLRIF